MVVYSQREPLGVVTAHHAVEFPVSIPARKIARRSSRQYGRLQAVLDAPLSGYRLAESLIQRAFRRACSTSSTGRGDVGPTITESSAVRAVTFTGSTGAGEHIIARCRSPLRTQMELGGKNPLIVMEDADRRQGVDLAVKGDSRSRDRPARARAASS